MPTLSPGDSFFKQHSKFLFSGGLEEFWIHGDVNHIDRPDVSFPWDDLILFRDSLVELELRDVAFGSEGLPAGAFTQIDSLNKLRLWNNGLAMPVLNSYRPLVWNLSPSLSKTLSWSISPLWPRAPQT